MMKDYIYTTLFYFLLYQDTFLRCTGDAVICQGTTSGLSYLENRVEHYEKLVNRYTNCTIVNGNLEITGVALTDPHAVDFLKDIEIVTGYVVIAMNYFPYFPLEKLRIIRGRELYKGKHALFLSVNYNKQDWRQGLNELRFDSLTEITNGSVYMKTNPLLCYTDTIKWDRIFNPINQRRYNWNANMSSFKRVTCGKCHPSCNGTCWGEGPDRCQTFTLGVCSAECGDLRCRGPGKDDCCDQECAAGCSGPKSTDCLVCAHVNNSGSCDQSCPSVNIYDPHSHRFVPNPGAKSFHYEDHCVEKCPSYLLVEENGCVKSCRRGWHDDGNGVCVECTSTSCEKDCYGVGHPDGELATAQTVNSQNIHFFEGCNIVIGNVVFLSHAFTGDAHNDIPPINIEQLNIFKSLKLITGFLQIVAWPEKLTNFSVFENLQKIEGNELVKNLAGVVIQDSRTPAGPHFLKHITSLGFRSLTSINHGNVYLAYMKNLCYDRTVNWTSIIKNPISYKGFSESGHLLNKNNPNCENVTCDERCSSDGCWGPGPSNCLGCKTFDYQQTCYNNCSETGMAVYTEPGMSTCQECHPECAACTGASNLLLNCTECKNYWDGDLCVAQCPDDKYPHDATKECLPCHENCIRLGNGPMCTGPNNTLGRGGCNSCEYVVITRSLEIVQCLPVDSQCPDAYFTYELSTVNAAKHNCMPCFDGCTNCTGLARSDCLHTLRSKEAIIISIIVPVVVLLMAVTTVVLLCRYRRRQMLKKRQHSMRVLGIDPHSPEESNIDPRARLMEPMTPSGVAPNQAQLRIVKETELRIVKILGTGAFGTVHKGYWIPDLAPRERVKVPVAIKVLKDESSQVASNEILDEAFVMASCEHPNLVRLLGISLSQRIMLISQLMPLGNLLEYVRENKESIGSQHILNWSLQIAKGMKYLSEEKHLVHRDLAARNVLVKSPNHVRITDFGLAKLLDVNEDVYRAEGGKMPIKWLALESIQHRIFTQKSDVWSFGVTMWELMTLGKKPYENVPAREVHTLLERGERLPQPSICTIDIYMMLIKCWTVDAEARPTFRELCEELSKMARDPQRYLVIHNDGSMKNLPSPTPSEFLRSLMHEEGDDFPITDAEEYLHPQDGGEIQFENGALNLQPVPSMVPWKRQHHPLSSTSSQQGLIPRGSGRFIQPNHVDRRLESVLTQMTNLSSVSGTLPNGGSSSRSDHEVVLGADDHLHESVLDRSFSEASDVFSNSPMFKRAAESGNYNWESCEEPRVGRAREDSTNMRYSADPISLYRQQTKPNVKTKLSAASNGEMKAASAEISQPIDEDGYLTPSEAANKKPEYLDPSEFPPSPFALKPPPSIFDPPSSLSNPEYEPTFVPDITTTETNSDFPASSVEYENTTSDKSPTAVANKDVGMLLLRRPSVESGSSLEKRDSGMQSDEETKPTNAVNNPNYDYYGCGENATESSQPEYVNTGSLDEREDNIFDFSEKPSSLPQDKCAQRTYSEPDSGVGIEVAVDNILYHKLGWEVNE